MCTGGWNALSFPGKTKASVLLWSYSEYSMVAGPGDASKEVSKGLNVLRRFLEEVCHGVRNLRLVTKVVCKPFATWKVIRKIHKIETRICKIVTAVYREEVEISIKVTSDGLFCRLLSARVIRIPERT